MSKRKKFLTHEDGKTTAKQHTSPCSDCPFLRDAVPGWLGGMQPREWIEKTHGEAVFECHVLHPHQCAGSAIYRANVLKTPRHPETLQLDQDKEAVFATPNEFLEHHLFGREP